MREERGLEDTRIRRGLLGTVRTPVFRPIRARSCLPPRPAPEAARGKADRASLEFSGWLQADGSQQESVIANQMGFWTRDEGREFFEQVQRSQDNVRVTPRPFEAIEQASIGQRL